MLMQTALTRKVLTNALAKRDTLAMDIHVQVTFVIQDDHECVSALMVLAHPCARSSHDGEFSNKLKQNL